MSIERQNEILPELREAVSGFLYPLKTTRAVKKDAFARLESVVTEATRICKTDALLSKALLTEIFVTTRAIEPEEPFVAIVDRPVLRDMREKLDSLFYLLVRGESPEDRVPGVPRIV
jgi:hypothetical protein